MSELAILVEGQTERRFVLEVLAPALQPFSVFAWPQILRGRGGGFRWQAARQEILRVIKERRDRVCSTMVDYYGLPPDWPGRRCASGGTGALRAAAIEEQISVEVAEGLGVSPAEVRFIPYVQLHEFEALLFSDPKYMGEVLAPDDPASARRLAEEFESDVRDCGSPELVDDSVESAPSKRIRRRAPGYDKAVDGIAIAARIGLPAIRARCPHFAGWVSRLEALGAA